MHIYIYINTHNDKKKKKIIASAEAATSPAQPIPAGSWLGRQPSLGGGNISKMIE